MIPDTVLPSQRLNYRFLFLFIAACGLAGCGKTGLSAAKPAPPATHDGAPMVFVPAGEFLMGSSVLNEQPQHTVSLPDYWIDTYEVTNARYGQCVQAGDCRPPQSPNSLSYGWYFGNPEYGSHPVNQISWEDAVQYCRWAGKRLPTEAEWEKAARGTDGRKFPWGDSWDPSKAHSILNELYNPVEVGSHPGGASPYGAMDMAGNLWEWTADWYAEDYYEDSPMVNPRGPETGTHRSVRGGGYGVYDAAMRTTVRRGDILPTDQFTYIGFRCVLSSE